MIAFPKFEQRPDGWTLIASLRRNPSGRLKGRKAGRIGVCAVVTLGAFELLFSGLPEGAIEFIQKALAAVIIRDKTLL